MTTRFCVSSNVCVVCVWAQQEKINNVIPPKTQSLLQAKSHNPLA